MAATWELFTSREPSGGDQPGCIFRYGQSGFATPQAAEVDLLATSPAAYVDGLGNTLKRKSWRYETLRPDMFRAEVMYGSVQNNEAGDWSFNFDTTGGRAKITQSLETVNRYAPTGKTATDHKGAIGVTKQGPQGADIASAAYSWTEVWSFAKNAVNNAYRLKVKDLTATMNNATFRGFPAKEVLFLGARGGIDAKTLLWKISFLFVHSESISDLTIGDIAGITKAGHDHVWIEYEEQEDSSSGRLATLPIAAHVERVYEKKDLGDLGLGTGVLV